MQILDENKGIIMQTLCPSSENGCFQNKRKDTDWMYQCGVGEHGTLSQVLV